MKTEMKNEETHILFPITWKQQEDDYLVNWELWNDAPSLKK